MNWTWPNIFCLNLQQVFWNRRMIWVSRTQINTVWKCHHKNESKRDADVFRSLNDRWDPAHTHLSISTAIRWLGGTFQSYTYQYVIKVLWWATRGLGPTLALLAVCLPGNSQSEHRLFSQSSHVWAWDNVAYWPDVSSPQYDSYRCHTDYVAWVNDRRLNVSLTDY